VETFETDEDGTVTAVVNLSKAYASHATLVRRSVSFDSDSLIIRDFVQCKSPSKVWWFMHTQAQITLSEDKREARLSQNGKILSVRIVDPSDGKFRVMDARPLPGTPDPKQQQRNQGIRKLAIRLDGVTKAKIGVELVAPPAGGARSGIDDE
jgi:hypothetical protein